MFAGEDHALLVALSALPSRAGEDLYLGTYGAVELYSPHDDEARLMRMRAAIDRAFDRCEDTVRHTDVALHFWLRSDNPDRPCKRAPFRLVGRESTTVAYRRLMERCVCFWMRFWRLLDAYGPVFKRSLSEGQRDAIAGVWNDDVWATLR